MQNTKKDFSLIIGLAIPILMIVFVAGSIYLPGIFIKPQYNFLYVSDNDGYYGDEQYSVQNQKLTKLPVKNPKNTETNQSKLYLHDVKKNESQEISYEEAQKLVLNSNQKSPDGFEVVAGSTSDGFMPFFFWSNSDYSTRYLKGHNLSKKLNLQLSGRYYYNNFRFLGWVQ